VVPGSFAVAAIEAITVEAAVGFACPYFVDFVAAIVTA
jgi:hypothetical protein